MGILIELILFGFSCVLSIASFSNNNIICGIVCTIISFIMIYRWKCDWELYMGGNWVEPTYIYNPQTRETVYSTSYDYGVNAYSTTSKQDNTRSKTYNSVKKIVENQAKKKAIIEIVEIIKENTIDIDNTVPNKPTVNVNTNTVENKVEPTFVKPIENSTTTNNGVSRTFEIIKIINGAPLTANKEKIYKTIISELEAYNEEQYGVEMTHTRRIRRVLDGIYHIDYIKGCVKIYITDDLLMTSDVLFPKYRIQKKIKEVLNEPNINVSFTMMTCKSLSKYYMERLTV